MLERPSEVGKKSHANQSNQSNAFSKFLDDEVKKRHLAATKFAEEVGVSPSTVTEAINGKTSSPSLPFLRKVATYTKTPITILIALAYPDVADEIAEVSAEDLMLAVRLNRLDPTLKKAVISIVNSD